MGPEDVGERHHRLLGDRSERIRHDVIRRETCPHDEAGTARSSHSERIPTAGLLELQLVALNQHGNLVGGSGIRRSSGRDQHIVCVAPIRDRRRLLLERETVAVGRHRRDAGAEIASHPDLGGGGGDEELIGAEAREIVLEERLSETVAHEASNLDLVHREDHPGRRAVAPSSKHADATASNAIPCPPNSAGTRAERAPAS